MNTKLFNLLSDDAFRVKAFAEYCSRSQERYSQWINQYQSFVEDVSDTADTDPASINADPSAWVTRYMTEHNISNTVVALEEGYVKVYDLLLATCEQVLYNDLYQEGDTTGGVYAEFSLDVADATGNNIRPTLVSLSSISDTLKSQLHSVTCLTAASVAYSEARGSISDAITIFNDKVLDIFSDAHADVSSSAQYMKGLLRIEDPSTFISTAITNIGIIAQAQATPEEDIRPLTNDISQYTGVSPAGALSFQSVGQAIATTAKAAATVVAGIAKSVGSIVGGLFSRAFRFFGEAVVNPMDLETANKNGFGTVDGFQYNSADAILFEGTSLDFPYPEDDFLSRFGNKWFAMKTRFSEWLFRFKRVEHSGLDTRLRGDLVFKPRVLNLRKLLPLIPQGNDVTYTQLQDMLTEMAKLGPDLYDVSGLEEREVFRGLVYSSEIEAALFTCAKNQTVRDHTDGSYIPSDARAVLNLATDDYGTIPATVTNLDWVKQFSGYNGSTFSLAFPYWTGVGGLHYEVYSNDLVESILTVLRFERDFPLEESPFIPYSNDHTGLEDPSYRIKTDAENGEALAKFLTVAIIVTVTAIVATTAVVLLKRAARKRYFKRAQRVGELDNKMWQGQSLTAQEQKAYVRASKKMSRSNVLSSGMSNPVSSALDNSRCSYDSNVLPYIIGEERR